MNKKSGTKRGGPASSGFSGWSAEDQVRLLSCALASLKDAVYITDTNHNIIYVNEATIFTQGYRPQDVLGKKAFEFFEGVPGNPPDLAGMITREARNGFWIGEIFNRRKDGSVFPVQMIENTIYGEKGEVIGYIGISRDISERYEAQARLTESEEKYRFLIEHALSGIYIVSTEGRIIYVNPRFEEMSGFPLRELIGSDIFRLIHPEDLQWVKEMSSRRVAGLPVPEYWTCRAIRKNGDVGWFEVRSNLTQYEGRPALLGNFVEITEQRRAYEALRESEDRMRTLIDTTPDCILFKDGEGCWLLVNTAVIRLFELAGVDYRGKTDRELSELRGFYRDVFLTCEETDEKVWRSGTLFRGEEVIPRPDGPARIMDVIKVPLYFPDGQRKGLVVLARDITDLKHSEERLREASKLETVGIMALAIAHEFNNILMGISGNAELAGYDSSDRVLVKKATSTIIRLTRRAKTMIRRLGTFGRIEKLCLKPVAVTAIIEEALALHERELKLSNIRIRKLYRDPALILADFSQLEQVFVNLIMNSCHAMAQAEKGTLSVQVENIDGEVKIRFADTGVGIPGDKIPRIFEPFFTTKVAGEKDWIPSLGLGLWVSRQIIKEHGGNIAVESTPGRGTTFIITLPKAAPVSGGPAGKPEADKMQLQVLKGKSILIVDDEEDLLAIFKKYLTGYGMEVTTVSNGEDGLLLCRKRSYDIILLDYVMPGLSGTGLVRKVKESSPASCIMVITGKRLPEEALQELSDCVNGVLRKPLGLLQMGEMLGRLVAGKAAGINPAGEE
ncbi:MAG: PAS domain S-box protein [PVC group bacterium]